MTTTHNKRVLMQEQIKLINECRTDWCHKKGIVLSTFYNWVSKCCKESTDILEPNYGHHETPLPKQDVALYSFGCSSGIGCSISVTDSIEL